MSTLTQLICRNFGGIRQKNAVFSEEMISAQNIQNVELYYTGINNGVGIRTMNGNASVNNTLAGSKQIVEIFETVQKGQKYFFVYAEGGEVGSEKGTLYNLNLLTLTLSTIRDNLTATGKAQGLDVIQGYSDLFFFTNGAEMFTIEMGVSETLYAYVYDTHIIYADSSTEPTKLLNSDGGLYVGSDWEISGTNVQYNGNNATYTSESNIVLLNTMTDMKPQDRNGDNVLGLCCAIYANRLFIAKGNKWWYSVTANIYDFATADSEWETSAGYIELLKNVTAIHPYLDSLAIFYSDSSCLLNVESGVFAISEESPAGCAGVNSLVFHDTNLYFYDNTKKAVFSFKQVISGQKTLGENIAIDIQEILQDIDETKLDQIKTLSVFVEGRNEIWWILPTNETYDYSTTIYAYIYETNTIFANSPTTPTVLYDSDGEEYTGEDWEIDSGVVKYNDNNATYTANSNKILKTPTPASIILIYDYLKGEWVKRKSQKINTVKVINNILYSGAEDGNILQEYVSNTFNGQYIQHRYDCSAWNLGAMNTLKVLVFQPRVSFGMPYTNSFYVKYVKNYNTFKKPKIKLIKSKVKNFMTWGLGHWGVDYWLNKNTSVIGKFPNATFKVLEMSIYTENVNQNFAIRNIEFSKIKVKQV